MIKMRSARFMHLVRHVMFPTPSNQSHQVHASVPLASISKNTRIYNPDPFASGSPNLVEIEQLAKPRFAFLVFAVAIRFFRFLTWIPSIFWTLTLPSIVNVRPFMASVTRLRGWLSSRCDRQVNELLQLTTVEPNASTLRTVINFDALSVGQLQRLLAQWAQHHSSFTISDGILRSDRNQNIWFAERTPPRFSADV